ncbi:hypothetical protein H072_2416 [Dactylellina haptotyla CBS 200.50]|uniref:Uncharacterized protein n=1 Tax=Dactylellina haptotyla (strain CBS 200.50) TaxID=1284197 RepID=S8AL09_DACHA|nr:hypothetical protein H072_2416 [Dactylellina haptotyla CBS 200.50]
MMPTYSTYKAGEPMERRPRARNRHRSPSPTILLPDGYVELHHYVPEYAEVHQQRRRRQARPEPICREESFCSTCAVDGCDPGSDFDERLRFRPPQLVPQATWNSMFVEDGSDDDYHAHHGSGYVEELSECSSCDEIWEQYAPPMHSTRRVVREPAHATRDINQKGGIFDAIVFYLIICTVLIVLRNVPGFFATFFKWDSWTGGDELG